MSKSKELTLHTERKQGNQIKVEKLFRTFTNKISRQGYSDAESWLFWMYTYLPQNDRGLMNDCIINYNGLEKPEVSKRETVTAKRRLIESLEIFSKGRDKDFKEMYSEKTSMERKKILMRDQVALDITEEAFGKWIERENKFKDAPAGERLVMWIEEMGMTEIGTWKKRMSRLAEVVGAENIEQIRPFGNAIMEREKNVGEVDKWEKDARGRKEAKIEEEREGVPVVYLGDREDCIRIQLEKWYRAGLNREGVEEDIEKARAGKEYAERIIGEL